MRNFQLPPATVSDALMHINADELRPTLPLLPIPKPYPTRKAEMILAIAGHLSGPRLQALWGRLDKTQQLAVRETLHDPERAFDADRFRARYGKLPSGYKSPGYRKSSLLRLFLYPMVRYSSPTAIPQDLRKRLLEFVPKPPEATLATIDELPGEIRQERRYVPKGQDKYTSATLVRRDMEQAAAYDLLAVLRLVDQGRVAVSAKTRRASAAAMLRIADVLTGGDFFDPTEKKKHRWSQVAGAHPAVRLAAATAERPTGSAARFEAGVDQGGPRGLARSPGEHATRPVAAVDEQQTARRIHSHRRHQGTDTGQGQARHDRAGGPPDRG